MALHIRDFRQNDAAGLSRLNATAHKLGDPRAPSSDARILAGLREDRLAAAIWFKLEGKTGIISTIVVAKTALWQSDVQELIAEASLWLASRGVTRIDIKDIPEGSALLAGLLDMHFEADERAGVMRRLVPARSAA